MILIVACPREGSSLVTSIFANHGLWTGDTARENQWGYKPYENIRISQFIKQHWIAPTRFGAKPGPDLKGIVLNEIPADQRAVIKTFVNMWEVWYDAFPDADFVLARRDYESALASAVQKSNPRSRDHAAKIIARRHERLDEISRLTGRPIINTSRLVEGDYSALEKAFSDCGLTMDPEIVRATIKKRIWRH